MTGAWKRWEGQIVNGEFQLRRISYGARRPGASESRDQTHSGRFRERRTPTLAMGAGRETVSSPLDPAVSDGPLPTGRQGAALCCDGVRRRGPVANSSTAAAHASGSARDAHARSGRPCIRSQPRFRAWAHETRKHHGRRRSYKTFERRAVPDERVWWRFGEAGSLRPTRGCKWKDLTGWGRLVAGHNIGRGPDAASARLGGDGAGRTGTAGHSAGR